MAPAKARHNAVEELKKREEEIAEMRQAKLRREAATRTSTSSTPKKLIPRPKGQAGRSDLYVLCFCFSRDLATNIRSKRIVKDNSHRYLDEFKTISGQDKTRLEKAKIQVRRAGGHASVY
ncbi:hypothetical protein B0H13DRAFT_1857086 [Mycena leptocephala]|nr:hypothetical protein B0H13DRAFT_1867996 [Mycena leptocephala]KAJ7932248.1 hypothetical protein B0H13DRAFT_1857086 [Mycena leptocephala]